MIYFNSNFEACAFEVENPVATIDENIWKNYCFFKRETTWDIQNGKFVQLKDVEYVQGYLSAIDRIDELKQKLSDTDYIVTKYLEGLIEDDIYQTKKEERQSWRKEINELQEKYSIEG